MRKITWILTLFLALFLQSCRSTKQVQTTVDKESMESQTVESPVKLRSDFEWYSASFSGNVNFNGERNGISGQIRIKSDEQIWLTVSAMGGLVPVANILITQDSVFLHNRIERTAMLRDLSFFKEMTGMDVTFEMLQDILMGSFLYEPNPAYFYEFSDGNKLLVQVKDPVQIELRLNYSRIQIDVPQNMPFSIPNSVKRI